MSKLSDQELWQKACAAISEVQGYSKAERDAYMRSGRPLPPMISTGGGNHVMTTEDGIEAIAKIGEGWRVADKDRKVRINAGKMREVSVSEFGSMLADNQMEFWSDTVAAVRQFKQRLDLRLKQIARDVEHYFPCRVLESPAAPSFSVGSVQFMRRGDWLKHISRPAGEDREEWSGIVQKRWTLPSKHTPAAHVRRKLGEFVDAVASWSSTALGLKPRRKSRAERQAEDILKAVGPCQWVAVVHVTGNELGRSEERARHAARLAMDALGVVLSASQALNLRGPGDEKSARHNVSLSRFDGHELNVGHHIDLPHLFSHPPFAEEFLNNTDDLRDDAGWAIDCLLRPADEIDFPTLKRRWCDALYWFGDARRDTSDFSALVRCGICLDVLAKGGKAEGIVNLMANLLGLSADDKFLSDGATLRSVITKIYNDGRSQLGHGGRPALLEDLPIARGVADQVAARAIDLYLHRLRAYTGLDDPDAFLAAIPALTSAIQSSATASQPASN